jgi:hypothetical protein
MSRTVPSAWGRVSCHYCQSQLHFLPVAIVSEAPIVRGRLTTLSRWTERTGGSHPGLAPQPIGLPSGAAFRLAPKAPD